jgi:glycosyltransferase involved in cell wall biosynthesis
MRLGIDASNIRSGGGVTHLRELLRTAEPEQYGITHVLVWAGANTLGQLPVRPWLQVIHEPSLDQPLPVRLYWQQLKLPRLVRQACDLLFAPGGSPGRVERPFVSMSRNMLPFESAEMRRYAGTMIYPRLLLLRSSQTRGYRSGNGVIFLTEYARSMVLRHVKRLAGPCTVIPHGVCERFRLLPRRQRSVTEYSESSPFRLLYVSIVDLYKHQWHVAEAIATLRRGGLPVVLDVVGPAYPPALRRFQETSRRVDPEGRFIRYHGPIRSEDLVGSYHQADGFVFASSCENMPNILLEAMAAGLPIACSRLGPMPEMLGEAGIYFDPRQPSGIAEALYSLVGDVALREVCAWSAYDRARYYSWQRCACETLSFLADVCGSLNDTSGLRGHILNERPSSARD